MKKRVLTLIQILLIGIILTSCNNISLDVKYKVSFYNEGILIKELDAKENAKIIEVADPVKEGYDFIGWYMDINDESTKWKFDETIVTSHVKLYAKWEIKEKYLEISNLRIEGEDLIWDAINDVEFEIKFLGELMIVSNNSISLSEYREMLSQEEIIQIKPIKDGYSGIVCERTITYKKTSLIESYRLDFDAFADSDFKELNKQTYKSSDINHDDHHLSINEARLTKETEYPKNGAVALILRNDGYIEFKEPYSNLMKMEFNLSPYNDLTTSSIELYVTNDLSSEWLLVKEFNVTSKGFTNHVVEAEEFKHLVLVNEPIYLKIQKKTLSGNLIIDDIVFYEKEFEQFILNPIIDEQSLSEYYKSASGLIGKSLVDELRIIVSTNIKKVSYKDIKEILEFSDISQTVDHKVVGIYDQILHRANWGTSSEWHREHVWPNSRLGMERVKESGINQASDPHNLRAITPTTNSSRSNRIFDVTNQNNPLGHTLPNDRYYPGDKDKGDVARILMYMVVRYDFLSLTNHLSLLNRPAYTKDAAFMGLLSNLINWHNEDPVDEFEIYRNEVIFQYQNNRNPFIDHPELFSEVYAYFASVDSNRIDIFLTINVEIDISIFKKEETFIHFNN